MHTHKHASNQSSVKPRPNEKKKTRGRTSIDSLLLHLHDNLALPGNLHGERNGLAYDDAFAASTELKGETHNVAMSMLRDLKGGKDQHLPRSH